jgi:hypothetical protein
MKFPRLSKSTAFWMLAMSVVTAIVLSPPVWAQYATGKPLVGNGTTTAIADGIFLDASQFSGTDACTKIRNAWTALPGNSGVIDARSITTGWPCTVLPLLPFVSGKQGKLLLGNVTIPTNVTWVIPTEVQVEGLGPSGPPLLPVPSTTRRA